MHAQRVPCEGILASFLFAAAGLVGLSGVLPFIGQWTRCDRGVDCMVAASAGFRYLDSKGITWQRPGGCGVAALHMVLRDAGVPISLEELEREFDREGAMVSLGRIQQVALKYGVTSTPYRVSVRQGAIVPLPAIVLFRHRHFVLVDMRTGGEFMVRDPAVGRLSASGMVLFGPPSGGQVLSFAVQAEGVSMSKE